MQCCNAVLGSIRSNKPAYSQQQIRAQRRARFPPRRNLKMLRRNQQGQPARGLGTRCCQQRRLQNDGQFITDAGSVGSERLA